MADIALQLDAFRSPDEQRATTARRQRLYRHMTDISEAREVREVLAAHLSEPCAQSWSAASSIAIYLLRLYSMAADAQEPNHRQLIARTIEDLARLSDTEAPPE